MNTTRIGAFGALGFSALVFVQNAVRGATVPPGRLDDDRLLHHVLHEGWTQALYCTTFALGLVGLYLFASAIVARADGGSSSARFFARLGSMGVVAIGVDFLILNALLTAMFVSGPALATQPALLRVLWDAHTAIFCLNMAAIGVALFGLSRAATELDLAPRWTRPLGAVGGALLVAGAIPAPQVTDGSGLIGVGIAGFVCWVAFLVAAGVRMLRTT